MEVNAVQKTNPSTKIPIASQILAATFRRAAMPTGVPAGIGGAGTDCGAGVCGPGRWSEPSILYLYRRAETVPVSWRPTRGLHEAGAAPAGLFDVQRLHSRSARARTHVADGALGPGNIADHLVIGTECFGDQAAAGESQAAVVGFQRDIGF